MYLRSIKLYARFTHICSSRLQIYLNGKNKPFFRVKNRISGHEVLWIRRFNSPKLSGLTFLFAQQGCSFPSSLATQFPLG